MGFLNKLVSGITTPLRAVNQLVTKGNLKNFKVLDNQKVATSLKQGLGGALVGGAVAGAGILGGGIVAKLVKAGGSKLKGSGFVSTVQQKLVTGLKSRFTSVTPKSLSVASPSIASFSTPLTGLQQDVFGAPPSNSFDVPSLINYQTAGLDNFNASSGDISVSTEKKLPPWLWPAVSLALAVFTILISLFSKKRR